LQESEEVQDSSRVCIIKDGPMIFMPAVLAGRIDDAAAKWHFHLH
jgi:hypothetical protein